jgi:hypothetical protein
LSGFLGFTFVAALDDGVVPAAACLIFFFVGPAMVAFDMRRSTSAARLLSHGVPATGRLMSKKATSMSIDEKPVLELEFAFTARDGTERIARALTHRPAPLLDEENEPLLYDPDNIHAAVVLDELPGNPRISDDGAMRTSSIRAALLVLVLPVMSVVVISLAIAFYPLE